jgi:hypothetical protein
LPFKPNVKYILGASGRIEPSVRRGRTGLSAPIFFALHTAKKYFRFYPLREMHANIKNVSVPARWLPEAPEQNPKIGPLVFRAP